MDIRKASLLFLMGMLSSEIMAWVYNGTSQEDLMTKLREVGTIKTERAFNILMATNRSHYTKINPYQDWPQKIGYKSRISAAHLHAYALDALNDKLREGATVLDVGSGSGYLTSCFARMVGPTGRVIGIEHIPELVEQSIANINSDDPTLLTGGRIQFFVSDGRLGYPAAAPYDVIYVGASTVEVPKTLLSQLKPGGRMVLPVGKYGGIQYLEQHDKQEDGTVVIKKMMRVQFIPLTDETAQMQRNEL
ncbi:l-isoaspartyl protein carboxyl methyltransferase, like [Erpetoichthys calabaricus]|uniref:Protein-L-isoaspartate O-methyltransferase n=1 Tax=Erpetoichthys calabaricus TaxID=27687 RepID=A0A8C4TFP5_ERPCA|nr:l-isoaspartyl protein carboxyl methyltransferase, like [Erpetoichthys calabaricus]